MTNELPISKLLYNIETDSVIVNEHADLVRHMASLTKLMTALVVIESGMLITKKLQLVEPLLETVEHTKNKLPIGESFSVHRLLTYLLISSNNAAAQTLAENYPGGYEKFLEAMNDKARKIGMTNTIFTDGSGSGKGNMSTAQDARILTIEALKNRTIRDIYHASKSIKDILRTTTLIENTVNNIHIIKGGQSSEHSLNICFAFNKKYIAVIMGSELLTMVRICKEFQNLVADKNLSV